MRFVHRDAGVEREWEVRLGRPDAVVADLAAALGCAGGRLVVDGREVSPAALLTESGLVMGSQLTTAMSAAGGEARSRFPDPDHTTATSTTAINPGAVLRITGGLDAGLSVPLPPGRVRLGRGDEADIRVACRDVSRLHC